ncbi:ABC transporter permease [Patescibacteria group bacterium]|nr:ABC transporter permease [Patescibacteria group bacterium]MBU1123586.1 ABC transporter permease [Patescibacteria group bacterium]MBU1911781.1 ABC transporter permease [Patescibacteria group bacterium]
MLLSDLLSTASKGITVNRMRSLLTMLGIIIGVGAVVLMTGVGKSVEGVILGQIDFMGPQTMALFPGNEGPEGGNSSMRPDFDAITFSDTEALKTLTTVKYIAPVVFVPGNAVYGREETDPRIAGSTPEYYLNQNIEVTEGRFHDQKDEEASNSVVVIGSDIAEDLFFNQSAVGKRMELANKKFTVIGVLKPVGMVFFQNVDDRIIMPLSTAVAMTGRTYADMVSMQAVDDFDIAFEDVRALLRQRHGITVPEDGSTDNDDFLVRSAAQAEEILGTVSISLTVFITLIAGISLFVGGIGIMNIMLVSVTERTREIGLRKAIGAKRKDILLQILLESVFLTLIGGCIGIVLGIGLDFLISAAVNKVLSEYQFAISIGAIFLALAMATVTGIVFGVYPAKKASELSPIEALRYE